MGVPQIIICGVIFVQATDLILRVFKAFRGGLDYSSLVRLSVSTANVAFTGFMCTAFTYCAELTRNAVNSNLKFIAFAYFVIFLSTRVLDAFCTEFIFTAKTENLS